MLRQPTSKFSLGRLGSIESLETEHSNKFLSHELE